MRIAAVTAGILAASVAASAFAALGPGSIAFTGFNADGNDDLAFVALEPIPANTIIFFTDEEWDGSAWATNTESQFSWVSPTAVTAGTVVTLNSVSGIYTSPTPTASASVGSITGISDGTNNSGISNSADTIYAYLGTDHLTPTAFLAAISNAPNFTGVTDGTLTNTGLTDGTTALLVGSSTDGRAYIGPRSGESAFADYLPEIGNIAANWTPVTSDGTTLLPFDSTPFSIIPEPATLASLIGLGALALRRSKRA